MGNTPQTWTRINGPIGEVAFEVSRNAAQTALAFETGPGFKATMNDTALVVGGRTVAEENVAWLHAKLQQWIDFNKGVQNA